MSDVTYKSPLYIQLREVIRSKIEEGEYPPGTAIPSESQLAETYGLNRLSVRSALSALEYEGILTSVQGKGVFVNGAKTERDLDTLGGYRHTMSEKSKDASTRVLIKALRKAYPWANIAAVDYDPGASEVNQVNRIKMMLTSAKKNLERT